MIICKECQHENMPGAIFCEQCVELLAAPGWSESTFDTSSAETQNPPLLLKDGKRSTFQDAPAECWIAVRMLDTDETLPLTFGDEFTVGRSSDDEQVTPDFDLTPYDALELGVSRVHLAIRHGLTGVLIKDLSSRNGTYLNGRRLQANMDETLNDGDVVSLSRLRIQILFLDQ